MPLLAILLSLFFAAPALAESQTYDPTGSGIENEAQQAARENRTADATRITPKIIHVTLAPHGKSTEQVGLRFSVPDIVNGCWNIGPLNHTHTLTDPYYFDVAITDYTRTEGECSGGNRTASATVPVEKRLLEQGKIKVLRLSVGPTTDKFNVSYRNGQLEILPASQSIFKSSAALTYNFDKTGKGKKQLVALIVPSAPAGMDTTQPVADYAAMHGLTPAPESATSSLEQTNGGSSVHYFYDSGRQLAPRLGTDFSETGTTTLPITMDMRDGRGQEYASAPVYGKRID